MNSLSTFSLSKSWVEVLEIVSSLSSVSCSAVKDVSSSVSTVVIGFWPFIICLFCLFFNILFISFSYDAFFPKISFFFLNFTSESESGSMHNITGLLLWSNVNSSSWYHSMLLFNFSNFLFSHAVYVLNPLLQ